MDTETDLLRAVARHPDEDTPRLAYADWLDEHALSYPPRDQDAARARAEFIRAHVRLAQLTGDSPERRELAFRCRQLLDAHEQQWLTDPAEFAYEWRWGRGFIEALDMGSGDLEESAALYFDSYPLRRVRVWALRGDVGPLNSLPPDHRLTALDLAGNGLTLAALRQLAKIPQLGSLRELGLMFNTLRSTAVKVLCEEPLFQKLALIRLGANPFSQTDRYVLSSHFGDRVTFEHERDPDHLYAVQDDHLRAGWANDLTQFLMLAGYEEISAAFFDHAGDLLRVEARPVDQSGVTDSRQREARRAAARDAWLAAVGYQSATVRVKRFAFPSGQRLTGFNWWARAFDNPDDPQREELVGAVERWLERGQYRFDFGGRDVWFDRDGEVTDT